MTLKRVVSSLMPVVLGAGFAAGCTGGAAPGPCSEVATEDPSEGWSHVPDSVTVTYRNNPPTSGPHHETWLRYKAFDRAQRRENWVHNLEHGAVVLLHRPDAPADVVADLRAALDAAPVDIACGHKRMLLTPDPQLDTPVAMVAARYHVSADRLGAEQVKGFVERCRARAPEDVCTQGTAGDP